MKGESEQHPLHQFLSAASECRLTSAVELHKDRAKIVHCEQKEKHAQMDGWTLFAYSPQR